MDITSSNNINKYATITSYCCVKNDIKLAHSYDSGYGYKKILRDRKKQSNKKIKSDESSKTKKLNMNKVNKDEKKDNNIDDIDELLFTFDL